MDKVYQITVYDFLSYSYSGLEDRTKHHFMLPYDRKCLSGFRFYSHGGDCTAVIMASLRA